MHDILQLIKEIMQSDVTFETELQRVRPQNSEVTRLLGDNSLIKKLTGFKPEYDIRKGLEITCSWFANGENQKKYKSGIYNL
jgi:nucleoside-diphosphate-sugar epimerase